MPAYEGQLLKAVKRGDQVNANRRAAAFLNSSVNAAFRLKFLLKIGAANRS